MKGALVMLADGSRSPAAARPQAPLRGQGPPPSPPHRARAAHPAARADDLVVETVRDPARWAALDSLWHELQAAVREDDAPDGGAATCFLTHEWLSAWWQHLVPALGLSCRPMVLLVWQGTRIVGAAPLLVVRARRRGVVLRKLMFMGAGVSDYQRLPVAARADAGAVLRALARAAVAERRAWDVLELDEYDGRDPHLSRWLAALADAGCRVRADRASACASLAVHGPWEDFYRTRVGSERRKKYRKAWRLLEAAGPVAFEVHDYVARDARLLAEIAALERAHPDAARDRPGVFNAPGYADFMRAVVPVRARGGEVVVAVLRVAGQAVAYLLFFVCSGRAAAYATSYHAAWAQGSPGSLLLRHALEHLWRRGVRVIDFNRGMQAYKTLWITAERHNLRISAWHGGWRARLAACWHAGFAGLAADRRAGQPTPRGRAQAGERGA